jgi:hypothetical protein
MKKLILIAALAASFSAQAGFMSGNKLLSNIQSTEYMDQSMAMGYIAGVVDAYDDTLFCTPSTATMGQMRDIIRNSMLARPESQHFSARSLIRDILVGFYPCAKKAPTSGSKSL